jgi:glycosyltransferase involved in cell wall biosynthesis
MTEEPLILKYGWFIKEKKDELVYRQTSSSFGILINNQSYDYIKFKFRYDFGPDSKTLKVDVDSSVRRYFVINKNETKNIIIPIYKSKNIDFTVSTNDECNEIDNVGFIVENIALIKGNSVTQLDMNNIPIEKELSSAYVTDAIQSEEKKKSFRVTFEDKRINLSTIKILSDSEFSGILYFGQRGTSGYAMAAKGNLCHFFSNGIPITWNTLDFDNSNLSDDCIYNAMIKSLVGKVIKTYDTVIIHSTPDLWSSIIKNNSKKVEGKKIIGYTVWETSKLPEKWVDCINRSVNEVWCPSTYNETVFKNSGVTIPIKVFPHVFLKKELPKKELVSLNDCDDNPISNNGCYTFYNISELQPRKGVEDLVKVFCESFTSKDNVRLVLKVHYKNYDDVNKKYCISVLNDIVSTYKDHANIYYILDNLTDNELLGLHSLGDCYVSLCKSEGFGLTIFEAYKYGKSVIVTGYGGQIDFLGKDYSGLVKYELGPVNGMRKFSNNYNEENQEWAYPNLEHAGELMRKMI